MTVAFIVINFLVYILIAFFDFNFANYILFYGAGLHPIQWVTSNFLHQDIFHLAGNMFFLWSFGIIVEGKLGWWKFFLLYMAIGVIECGLEQILMRNYLDPNMPGSLGASSIIFGLMMICLIWAPLNELTLFLFIFLIRVIAIDFNVKIRSFCLFHLFFAVVGMFFSGFAIGTNLLHFAGGIIGVALGIALLQLKLVDCENWDLFSVMKGEHLTPLSPDRESPLERDYRVSSKKSSKSPSKKRRRKGSGREKNYRVKRTSSFEEDYDEDPEVKTRKEKMLKRFRRLLKNNKASAALIEYQSYRHTQNEFQLEEADLLNLADGLFRSKKYSDAIIMYEQYTSRFPRIEEIEEVHLRLAAILVEIQRRPVAAQKRLAKIDLQDLSEKHEKQYQKIENRAQVLIDNGVIEKEGESWS